MILLPDQCAAPPPDEAPPDPRAASLAAIRRLHRRASQGLFVLATFLLLSFAALDNFSLLPAIPPVARETLGAGPTPNFISMALVVYLFSAAIMALARMMSGSGQTGGLAHLGYLGAFYGFFHYAGALADNIWAVLGSGVTILSLEAYQLWNYCQEEIRQEQETIANLERKQPQQNSPRS